MKTYFFALSLIFSFDGLALCLPNTEFKLEKLKSELIFLEGSAQHFETLASRMLPAEVDLLIQLQPLNSRVNAEINKNGNTLVIDVFGGMLNHKSMNENSLKLLLCHEVGHYLGGPPFKSRGGWSSTEGQSDFFSGETCSRYIGMTEKEFFDGALRLTSIYAEVMNEMAPKLGQCDGIEATRTIYGYPSVQCRLDSIIAGRNGASRPRCWFID